MYKKIPTKNLQPGMYIVDTGIPWLESPYLYSKNAEANEELIASVLKGGFLEVFIDPERSRNSPESAASEQAPLQFDGHQLPDIPILTEMKAARKTYVRVIEQAKVFMDGIRRSDPNLDLREARPLVDDMLGSLGRNPDALISLCKLRSKDDYTYAHSVNVAVLGAMFAKHLGFSDTTQHDVGLAGILHDLGKAMVPLDILNAPRSLSEQEFAFLRKHPRMGYEQAKKTPGLGQDVLMGIYDHHERFDGRGYPRGVSGEAISVPGRILAIIDVYDALSSRRAYKEAILPHRVLGIMYQMRGSDFFPGYIEHFIRMIGIYPVGSVVELQDGRVGVVTASNDATPSRPRVLVVRDKSGATLNPVELDVNLGECPPVQRCLNADESNIDAARLLGVNQDEADD